MKEHLNKQRITSFYELSTVKERLVTAYLIDHSPNTMDEKKRELEDLLPHLNFDVEALEKELRELEKAYPYRS